MQIRITAFDFDTNILTSFVDRNAFLKKCQVLIQYTKRKLAII